MRDVRCVWPVGAVLGEGPVWSAEELALWFVDIKQHRIHRFHPANRDRQSWETPGAVSFTLPTEHGWHVAGLPGRLARFDPANPLFDTLVTLTSEVPGNRLNDACIDAAGRLWFGSMDDGESAATGRLYSWDGASAPSLHDGDFVISNGPAHSPDGCTLYHTDTLRRTIFRFDIGRDGTVSNKRPCVVIEEGRGYPDGTTVDQDGCLWVALFGGAAVRRYSPDGVLLETVAIPCLNVTKLAFGGDGLRTAFVTTARIGLPEGGTHADDGGLFAFAVDVPGLAQRPMVHPGS